MAYAKFGFLYQGDKFLRGTLRQHHVAKAIKVNDKRALIAIRVLNEFLKSADLTVELKHAEAIRAEMSSEDWNKVYGGKSNVREKLGSQSPEENLGGDGERAVGHHVQTRRFEVSYDRRRDTSSGTSSRADANSTPCGWTTNTTR
jgi:hypothetical protein